MKQTHQHPVEQLPFVANKKKPVKGANGRCFWSVTPSGDYAEDCKTGKKFALTWIAYARLSGPDEPDLLAWIVKDMPRIYTGLEIGFLSTIGEEIMRTAAVPQHPVLSLLDRLRAA